MQMTLNEIAYSKPITAQEELDNESLFARIVEKLPKDAENHVDMEKLGKLIGDACFDVAGVEATDRAREVFKTVFLQSLMEGFTKKASDKQALAGSFVKGIFESEALGPRTTAFLLNLIK